MKTKEHMIGSILKKEYEEYRILLRKTPSLLLTVFVLAVVLMNLLANKELFRTDWVALDCGFVLSWLPFLLMDAVCKAYGGRDAARLSVFSVAVNLCVFAIFKLISLCPGMWGAYYETRSMVANDALNHTVGGSTWIVICSAAAMTVSAAINSLVNISLSRFFRKDTYGAFAVRSFVSTAVSQFADNLVFALTVCIPLFGWSMRQVMICSAVSAGFELSMEILFSGLGYRLAGSLGKQG